VFGIYYMTKERPGAKGEDRLFADPEDLRIAYDNEDVDLQARIRMRWNGSIIETTVGRALLNDVVPEPLRFVNKELKNPKVIEISIYERTERSAVTDGLTGLYNHSFFLQALRPLGINHVDFPFTPARVWAAIQASRGRPR